MSTVRKPSDHKPDHAPEPPDQPLADAGDTETEPKWDERPMDPAVVEAAKKVFARRRDLLKRLA